MNCKRALAVAATAALIATAATGYAASAPAKVLEVDRIVAVVNEDVITR
jgi:hypothetical protein